MKQRISARGNLFQWITGCLFVVFCTIPWVNFGLNQMDSQPWSFFTGILFLFFSNPKIKYANLLYLILCAFCFGIVLIGNFKTILIDFLLFRAMVNYSSLFLVFIAFSLFMDKFGFPKKILLVMNIFWLFGGLLEVFFPGILSSIVLERTTADRGVTSFSPEPTYFAIYLFFNSWLLFVINNYRPDFKTKLLIIINGIAIIFLAKSAMGVLFLLLAFGAIFSYSFFRLSFKVRELIMISVAVSFGMVLISFFSTSLDGSRVVKLITSSKDVTLFDFFHLDASMNARLAHIVLSIHGFIHNWGAPGGFHTFGESSNSLRGFYSDYFWYGVGSNRIMSWIGSFLYELGVFGFLILTVFISKLSDKTRRRKFEIGLLFLLLLSAIPLSFPFIPMLMAVLYRTKQTSFGYSLGTTQNSTVKLISQKRILHG